MKKYLNQWIDLDFNGKARRAKIIDIEFETGFGPLFLMQTKRGNRFWLTKEELDDHETIY
jgi:hypothetical protein